MDTVFLLLILMIRPHQINYLLQIVLSQWHRGRKNLIWHVVLLVTHEEAFNFGRSWRGRAELNCLSFYEFPKTWKLQLSLFWAMRWKQISSIIGGLCIQQFCWHFIVILWRLENYYNIIYFAFHSACWKEAVKLYCCITLISYLPGGRPSATVNYLSWFKSDKLL